MFLILFNTVPIFKEYVLFNLKLFSRKCFASFFSSDCCSKSFYSVPETNTDKRFTLECQPILSKFCEQGESSNQSILLHKNS